MSKPDEQPTRLTVLQRRVSMYTWVITLLLSIRGLYAFYGMKEKGSFEQVVTYVTEPVVQLFRFDAIERLAIPGISVLFAVTSILLISYILQLTIKVTELRISYARNILVKQAIRAK